MSNLMKEFFLTFFTSSMASIREELGLARGMNTAEALWKRLAQDIFPVLNEQIKTEGDELTTTVEFLDKVFTDVLHFENVETRADENSASLILNDCPFWNQIKEKKLPPATHKLCSAFIETLARLKSPGLIFDKIGCRSMPQGGSFCEFVWKLF
ncbi:MAG: hypothetical protein HWN67_08245 [Candidatus Helarchaeota archaeon]|nr:hypothetical protein [Candidatus Helarchaeota archaeon]